MELSFELARNRYSSIDLNRLAESITRDGMIDAAYQLNPDSVYWTCVESGELLGLTYERAEDVVGWSLHTTRTEGFGGFRSVAVIPSDLEDEVWFLVRRIFTTDGDGNNLPSPVEKVFIERMTKESEMTEVDSLGNRETVRERIVRVDAAVVKEDAGGFTIVDGLDHLEGQLVQILADGAVMVEQVVAGGQVSLINPDGNTTYTATIAEAGLGYKSRVEPMTTVLFTDNGSSRFTKVNAQKAFIRVFQTFGGEVGTYKSVGRDTEDSQSNPLVKEPYNRPMDGVSPLRGGVEDVALSQKIDYDTGIYIEQNQPLPLTVLGIAMDVEVNENS